MTPADLFIKANSKKSKNRLYFFHHAGGNAAQYLPLFQKLDMDLDIQILNLPGRSLQSKTGAYTDFKTLIDACIDYFLKNPTDNIFLLGHSMGSLMVYDLVRRLDRRSDFHLMSFGISSLKAPNLRFRKYKISHLPESAFLKEIEFFQPLPGMVKNQKAVLDLTLETLRNDFKIIESFSGNTQFFPNTARGYLFGGLADPLVKENDLLVWHEMLEFQTAPIMYSGDHFYIFKALDSIVKILISSP